MLKTTISLLNYAVWIVLAVFLVIIYVKTRRAKAAQAELVRQIEGGAYLNWFRIKLATPEFFKKRMKLVGFQSSALLVNGADHVRVLAVLPGGERIDRSYPKQDLQLQWIGNPGLASSNMHWISLGSGAEQVMLSADTGFNAVQSREATADICRMIDPAFRLPALATSDFALEKNKASLALVVVFFALLAFALVDGIFLNANEFLGPRNLPMLAPCAAILAIPAYLLLVRGRVPSRESLALSMLLATGLALAFMPAVKRADQLLAGDTKTYQYKLVGAGRLTPLDKDLPPIAFPRVREYWAQFEPGSVHEFQLIHGPLGLWQLERERLNAEFRKFYIARDGAK